MTDPNSLLRNIICTALLSVLMSCVTPVNSVFESAKLLDKGGIELQGSYNAYYIEDLKTNDNYGFAIGYGVSDRYTIKLRYERINALDGDFESEFSEFDTNYIEFTNKYSIWKDRVAFSIPVGIYANEFLTMYQLDPRLFFTFGQGAHFEFNIIPKLHIFFGDGATGLTPGINVGLGLSSDLSKWAIRPEIGYDSYTTFGLGLNFYLNPKEKNNY